MATTMNMFDLIFLFAGLLFLVIGFFRGFVKEIFSLFVWIIALLVSFVITPFISPYLNLGNDAINDVVTRSVLFIIVFFITNYYLSKISNDLTDRLPDALNRSLGILYGIAKTLIVFGVFYCVFLNSLMLVYGNKFDKNSSQFPQWLKEAKCYGLVRTSGEIINPIFKKFFDSAAKNYEKYIPKKQDENEEATLDKIMKDNSEYFQENLEKVSNPGYSKKDIEKMNHLIDIIDK